MSFISKEIVKRDSDELLTGKPVFLDDVMPDNFLSIKILRSPYPNAIIKNIDTTEALKLSGIENIFTYKDIDQNQPRYNAEGEEEPTQGSRDRLILDQHVRFVGDAVAIICAVDEKTAEKAIPLIKVEYDVLEPILDFEKSLDNPIIIHPEENWKQGLPTGADNKRNLCGHKEHIYGDIEKAFSECDEIIERTYHTHAVNQAPIETFRSWAEILPDGKLHVATSTQVVYLIQRRLSDSIGIPMDKIRVSKKRVGGGFGAKGSLVSEVYPGFVTWKTKKPSKLIYSRKESFIAGSPRHEIKFKIKLGATKDGILKAVEMYALSNAGAYSDHAPTVLDLALYIPTSIYRNWDAFKLTGDVVYSNKLASGAYRGYGATQGGYAFECAVNEMAAKLKIDPVQFRKLNTVKEGDILNVYSDRMKLTSCTVEKCLLEAAEMIGWNKKYPFVKIDDHTVRSVGIALSSQTTSIAKNMTGSAILKTKNNFYELYIASGDVGTGSDTSVAQIAADTLECDIDKIKVFSGDTETTEHDSGSYASASLYITGKATELACRKLKEKFAELKVEFANDLETKAEYIPPVAPPPFLAGAVEIELDTETGSYKLMEYDAAVDCGTAINPKIVKAQIQGAAIQGFGMAATENISYTKSGELLENSFMNYKIPAMTDVGKLNVRIVPSYEETGPYGAKGVGEVGVNSIAPAIQNAIFNATGVMLNRLPMRPEDILMNKK